MSFPRFRPLTAAFSMAVMLSYAGQVEAQLFGNHCSSCNSSAPQMAYAPAYAPAQSVAFNPCNTCAPAVAYNPCVTCEQPQQVVYRTVPVTEYQQVAQTVRRPVVETAYEDRQFTEYRTVYEQRTAQIPTVSYQNVTECQTVTRDMGQWVTCRQPIPRYSPCAYDSSPGLLGALNRTSYQLRSAFGPRYSTHRQYVPNVVAQSVPVTRQVATRGMQTVSYQVAKLEPYTVTKQVAVRKVRYEEEQVVAMRPVTSYRTVPIGTQTAFGFIPFENNGSGTTTAQAPTPDHNFSKSAEAPTAAPRTADKNSKTDPKGTQKDSGEAFNPFPSGSSHDPSHNPVKHATYEVQTVQTTPSPASSANPTVPSMIRVTGWRARATQPETSLPPHGPEASGPSLHVANATH